MTTTVTAADGRKHTFEWGPKSLFSVPLNSKYRHFNGSGREPARLAATNNLTWLMNLFRTESFIYDNAHQFPERAGDIDVIWVFGYGSPAWRGGPMSDADESTAPGCAVAVTKIAAPHVTSAATISSFGARQRRWRCTS